MKFPFNCESQTLHYLDLNGASDARSCEKGEDSCGHSLLRGTGICITGYEIRINIDGGAGSRFSVKLPVRCAG